MAKRTTPDLTGRKFGKWTVYEEVEKDGGGKIRYRCQCECGEWSNVRAYELLNGHSICCKRCGQKARGETISGRTVEEVREYMKTHTTTEGARHFGVAKTSFYQYMRRHDIPWPQKRYAKPKREQMVIINPRHIPNPDEVARARKAFNLKSLPRLREGINDRSPHEERKWKYTGADYIKRMREYEKKVRG